MIKRTNNQIIAQKSKFIDVLIDMKIKMENLTKKFSSIINNFSENQPVEGRQCFWCDYCNEQLKPNERFVKFEVWQDMFHYHNDLIADTFKVYHVKCFYKCMKDKNG